MKNLLLQTDENLKAKLPALYSQLQAPLLNDEIKKSEQQYKVNLPPDIKEWYRWKNGQFKNAEQPFFNGHYFFALDEMLSIYTDKSIGLKDEQFPLFGNRLGRYRSYICVDFNGLYRGHKGEVFAYHSSEPFDEDIATDMESLVVQINEHLQKTPEKKLKGGIHIAFNGKIRER